MKLFEIIDGLLAGAVYLFWAIALIGIPMTLILFFVNLGMGFASAMVFVAAFLLSIAVTLLLLPAKLAKGKLADQKKRVTAGCVLLVLAAAIMGITYFACGGFPAMNLIFV
ncbi:MAG: hypothetical protein Q4F81_10715 [Eubacteriales bacterium]|nr:hypothetical protein [Eubacteriales bacterium]